MISLSGIAVNASHHAQIQPGLHIQRVNPKDDVDKTGQRQGPGSSANLPKYQKEKAHQPGVCKPLSTRDRQLTIDASDNHC